MPNLIDITLTLIDKVSPSTNQIARSMANTAQQAVVLGQVVEGLQNTLGALAAARIVDSAIGTITEFAKAEEAIRRVETVAKSAGVTIGSDLANSFQTAKDFAKDHKFAVEEVLDTYFELGSAGFDLAQSIAIGEQALFLSNAVMLDAATSTQLLASVMNSLGQTTSLAFLSVEDGAKRASNALAQSIQIFAVTGEQLEAGLKFVIGSASLLGVEIEDLTTALGQLNTVGLKGSTAGTSLNQAFIQLDRAIGKLGLDTSKFIDEAGNFKTIADLVNEVKRATSNLSPFERFNAIIDGFESRGARAIAALLPFSGVMEAVTQRMARNADEAKRLSDIYENNLQTSIQKTSNRISVLQQEIGQNLAPAAKGFLETSNFLIDSFASLNKAIGPVGTSIGAASVAIVGLRLGIQGLSTAFALATSGSAQFAGTIAASLTTVVTRFGIFAVAAAGTVAILGQIAKASEDARRKLLSIEDIRLENLETQLRKTFAIFSDKDFEKSVEKLGQLNKLKSTAFGQSSIDLIKSGRDAGFSVKDLVDIQKQSSILVSSFEPFKDIGIPFTTPDAIDQANKSLALLREIGGVLSDFGGFNEESSKSFKETSQAVAKIQEKLQDSAAVQELSRISAIIQEIGDKAASTDDQIKQFATQFGISADGAVRLADTFKSIDLKQTFSSLSQSSRGSLVGVEPAANDLINLTRIVEFLRKRIEAPLEFAAGLATSFNDVLVAQKELEKQNTKVGSSFEAVRKTLDFLDKEKNVSPDRVQTLTGNLVSRLETGFSAQQDLAKIQETLRNSLKKAAEVAEEFMQKTGNTAGKSFVDAFINEANGIDDDLAKTRQEIENSFKKLDLFKGGLAAGQLPFSRGDIKDLFSKSVLEGLKTGADGARGAFATGLIGVVDSAIAQGVVSGLSKANAVIPQILDSLTEASARIFTKIEAGANVGETIKKETEGLKLKFNLEGINTALEAVTQFRTIVFNDLIPGFGPKLGNAIREGLEPLDKASEQIGQIRAQLLTLKSPVDRNALEQLINLNRGSGIVGGIEIAGADLPTKIKALENLIAAANVPSNGNLLSSQTISLIVAKYEELATKAERTRSTIDVSEPAARSKQSISDMGGEVGKVNSSVDLLYSKFSSIPEVLDEAIEKLDTFAGKLKSLSGSTTVSSNSENALNVTIGDFNISIDANNSEATEEKIDEVREELKKANEKLSVEILSRLGDILRRR